MGTGIGMQIERRLFLKFKKLLNKKRGLEEHTIDPSHSNILCWVEVSKCLQQQP